MADGDADAEGDGDGLAEGEGDGDGEGEGDIDGEALGDGPGPWRADNDAWLPDAADSVTAVVAPGRPAQAYQAMKGAAAAAPTTIARRETALFEARGVHKGPRAWLAGGSGEFFFEGMRDPFVWGGDQGMRVRSAGGTVPGVFTP